MGKGTDTAGLTGFKIDLRPYKVKNRHRDPEVVAKDPMVDFEMEESLVQVVFHPDLKLKPDDLFKAKDIADIVRESKKNGGFVVVTKEQMAHIRKGYDCLTGLQEDSIEFLKRIRDAESVILEEKVKEA